MTSSRTENDSIGEVKIASDALWGSGTQRALDNFQISTRKFPLPFIHVLALIKQYAAEANMELGLMEKKMASAVMSAAEEVANGLHESSFPLDVFQTGSGTSTNMNMNEVIASLANRRLGGKHGKWDPIHPNDHVNMCQSSNDVMPAALYAASAYLISSKLLPALEKLFVSLQNKAHEFASIIKIGRTHLMDALPVKLGHEFGGWARDIELAMDNLKRSSLMLNELALGGTAVGTGAGAHADFSKRVCRRLAHKLKVDLLPAKNKFEALSSRTRCAGVSGSVKCAAVAMSRIAEDIRLLASGPRLGIGELVLPSLAPGSSMMPGKVNPVVTEMVIQVATQVIGNDLAVTMGARAGHLELNTHLPLIASNMIESIEITTAAANTFADKCVKGIAADGARCRLNVERSLALSTMLVSKTGYTRAAFIAKRAHETGKTVREIALEEGILNEQEIEAAFDLARIAGT